MACFGLVIIVYKSFDWYFFRFVVYFFVDVEFEVEMVSILLKVFDFGDFFKFFSELWMLKKDLKWLVSYLIEKLRIIIFLLILQVNNILLLHQNLKNPVQGPLSKFQLFPLRHFRFPQIFHIFTVNSILDWIWNQVNNIWA